MPDVVIIGAGPGLGMSAARAFAAAGYGVGLLARTPDRVTEAVTELRQAGHRAFGRPADAGDPDSLHGAVRELVTELGGVDVLHHNVSVYRNGGVDATSPADLAADLEAGAVSLLSGVRAVLPELQERRGAVVVTGGGAADRPPAAALTLGPQKAAVRALTLAVAKDLAGRGITVRTLTIRGGIAVGTPFDPALVAQRLVALAEDRSDGPVEVDYTG
jgi:NADP-dependent 3-hydroxy acid dehydrogenase YdfG